MNFTPLKKARLLAGLTQEELATAAKVSQSTYQRWEKGEHPIPEKKRGVLSKKLGVSVNELQGEEEFDLFGVEQISADRTYFGEVTFHFGANSKPLLLSITVSTRSSIVADIQDQSWPFIVVTSVDNRIVCIRKNAITDIYLNSEAFDDFGPEVREDYDYIGPAPFDRFWELVENIECLEMCDEFSEEEKDHILKMFGMREIEHEAVPTEHDGGEKLPDVEKYMSIARAISWQLSSSGKVRNEYIADNIEVFNMFEEITNVPESFALIDIEGYYKTAIVNMDAVDYFSVPLHKYNKGQLETLDKEDNLE